MKIVIVANFAGNFDGSGNNRFNYLAALLSKKGHDVELVTSTFSHGKKKEKDNIDRNSLAYKVKLIPEPGYRKNVSIKRLYSHWVFGNNVKKYLETINKLDVIYIAVPSLTSAKNSIKFAKKKNIKSIIDIQDLWPEAFQMVVPNEFIGRFFFLPMRKIANYIYRNTDEVIAVSDTYRKRAEDVRLDNRVGKSIYLGTNLDRFDEAKKRIPVIEFKKDVIYLAYVGTLGHSYDLTTVIKALGELPNNICFVIMGDGPLRKKFEAESLEESVNTIFTGKLRYEEMVSTLCHCDIAINSITKGAAQSIINKHSDYAAAGLPVINTQENMEYQVLVEENNIGINCENSNVKDMKRAILSLVNNEINRKKMGSNHRRLAEKYFDRRVSYMDIVQIIEK